MKISFILAVNVSDKFWYPHTVPSNFYFLSSRVIQLTAYFMILLVLIFIVNRNFKLLNRHSILLLCALTILLSVFFLYYYCLRYCCYCYLLIIIYLFIYLFIFITSSICLFCGLDLYEVQPFKSSPHIRFATVYIACF